MSDTQAVIATLIGRDVAFEKAVQTLIGSPQKEPLALTEVMRTNFQLAKQQIPGRLREHEVPDTLLPLAEGSFALATTAVLRGVASGKYVSPAR